MDCPICGYDNDGSVNSCGRCGTDFSFLKTKERNGDNPVSQVKRGEEEKEEGD